MGRGRKPAKAVAEKPVESNVAEQPDWFPYDNTRYFNAAMLPPVLQEMIKGGGRRVYFGYKRDYPDPNNSYRESILQQFGFDLEDPKDCQIWADLISEYFPKNGVEANRNVSINYDGEISVANTSFSAQNSPEGTGYSMVARQVAAAQEMAKRTGRTVVIHVGAAQSDPGGTYNGVATWPKLGYNFDIPYEWQRELIDNYGFKLEDVQSGTQHFMDKRNNNGYQGWDVWRDLVESVEPQGLSGFTEIYPDGSETPAMRITREYGKRKGYNADEKPPRQIITHKDEPPPKQNLFRTPRTLSLNLPLVFNPATLQWDIKRT